MNRITNSAAMLVRESGSKMSKKNRIGVAPSIRDASVSSSGIVMKNWRNRNVAVALAISGMVRPAYVLSMLRCETTAEVGTMRASTGSIRVMKMIQNAAVRNGKRKDTIANADSSETAMLPAAE